MTLKGKSITIRTLDRKHLETLRQMRNDPETSLFLTSVRPITEAGQEEWFRKMSLDDSRMYFAIEQKDGTFVGIIRCDEWDKINRSIRIGLDISPEHRRKGYATEGYRLLIRYLFEQLGLHRIWLLVAAFNQPAITLYKKLGFVIEGIQRQALYRNNMFNDYIMMSRLAINKKSPARRGK